MTTTTSAPATDITNLLPLGLVVEVTLSDAGTQTRITGGVTGYTRGGRWPSRHRPITGAWVGDAWVSTDDALEAQVRLCEPGEAATPLSHHGGFPITLAAARVGDVLYVAFPYQDGVVQALGRVDVVDEDGEWVALDGEMTLSAGVPYFTIRRLAAAEIAG